MRAFRYRLAAVLQGAQHVERMLQLELTLLEEELARVDQRIDALRGLQQTLHARVRGALAAGGPRAGAIQFGRLQSAQHELERVDALLEHASRLRQEMRTRADATRGRLVEAARSRRSLEKHREGLAHEHLRSELGAETARQDELASLHRGNP